MVGTVVSRRRVLQALAVTGVGTVVFRRALASMTAEGQTVTPDMNKQAEWIAGLEYTDDELVRQEVNAWPNEFRQGQLIPAVEYLRANRIRTLLMEEMGKMMEGVDVYVSPTYGGSNLLLTNLTGHPSVVVPHGFRPEDGTPTSITFTGSLHGDDTVLAVAHAYQRATDFHQKRPPLRGPD